MYVVLSLVTDIATSVFKSSASSANTTTREVDGVEFAVNVSETKVILVDGEPASKTKRIPPSPPIFAVPLAAPSPLAPSAKSACLGAGNAV